MFCAAWMFFRRCNEIKWKCLDMLAFILPAEGAMYQVKFSECMSAEMLRKNEWATFTFQCNVTENKGAICKI